MGVALTLRIKCLAPGDYATARPPSRTLPHKGVTRGEGTSPPFDLVEASH